MTPDPIRRRRIPILYLVAQTVALALGAATWALDMIMTAAERRRTPSGARSGAAQPRRITMNAETIGGIVRHALTALGGYLVASGVLDPTQMETVVGAVVTVVGVVWSVWQKRQAAD